MAFQQLFNVANLSPYHDEESDLDTKVSPFQLGENDARATHASAPSGQSKINAQKEPIE